MPIQDVGKGIMELYLQGLQLRQQRQQQAVENQQRQQQLDQQQKQFEEHLKQQSEQFNIQQNLEKSKFEAAKAQAKPIFAQAMMQGLIPSQPEVKDIIPGQSPGFPGNLPIPRAQLTGEVPGFGKITAPTPQDFAETQRILGAPKNEAAQQLQLMKAVQSWMQEQAKLASAEKIAGMQVTGKHEDVAAQIAGRHIDVATMAAARRATAAVGTAIDPEIIADYADQRSRGLIKDSQIPVKIRPFVIHTNRLEGKVGIDPDKRDAIIGDIAELNKFTRLWDNLFTQFPNEFGRTKILGGIQLGLEKAVDTKFGKAISEMEGQQGALSRAVGKERGVLTQKDIERSIKLNPSVQMSLEDNVANAQKFKQEMNAVINTRLSYIPPTQRQQLFDETGVPWLRATQVGSGISPTEGAKAAKTFKVYYSDGSVENIPDTPENRAKYQRVK